MATTTDPFPSTISNESLEVLQHFGPEAPIKLNIYTCQLEDAFLEALEQRDVLQERLRVAEQEQRQMQAILTDPD